MGVQASLLNIDLSVSTLLLNVGGMVNHQIASLRVPLLGAVCSNEVFTCQHSSVDTRGNLPEAGLGEFLDSWSPIVKSCLKRRNQESA